MGIVITHMREYFLTVFPYNREEDPMTKKTMLFGVIRSKAATHRDAGLSARLTTFIERERAKYERSNVG